MSASQDGKVRVDMDFAEQLWTIYRTDPTVGACANLLRTRLLGLGVMYMYGDASHAPRREFYEFVTRRYSAFARDAMEHLMVLGFCAYVIAPAKKKREIPYPVVIPFGKAAYSVKYNDYYQPSLFVSSSSLRDQKDDLFGLGSSRDEGGDKRALFIVLNYPDANGRPCSPVSQVYAVQAMKRQMEANVLYADRVRARPPILTQSTSDKTFDEKDLVGIGAVNGDVNAAIERKNLMRKNQMNVEIWEQQSALVDALNSGQKLDLSHRPQSAWQARLDPVTKLPIFTMDGGEVYTPNFIPLPTDATTASMQMPTRMNDFIEMERLVSMQTAICMGVNPQALLGTGGTSGATSGIAELTDTTINFTIMRYRSALADGLVDIFDIIHSRGTAGKRVRSDVTVIFPSAQRPELLTKLVGSGFLSYEYYVREMATFYSLPVSAFNSEPEPLVAQQDSKKARNEKEDKPRRDD